MSTWMNIDGTVGLNQDIDETSTTQNHPLGYRVRCFDQDTSTAYGYGEFVYLKGVASTAIGSVVLWEHGVHTTALASANGIGMIGVAMSANVANQYGWYQVVGTAAVKVLASFAADKVAYLTGTAGSLDDAVVAGDEVYTSYSSSAIDTPSTGLAEIGINNPWVTNASN